MTISAIAASTTMTVMPVAIPPPSIPAARTVSRMSPTSSWTVARSLRQKVQCCANHRLGVDLMVLVELADVARLAEVLDAEAGDRRAQERERMRVAVEQRDDRHAR